MKLALALSHSKCSGELIHLMPRLILKIRMYYASVRRIICKKKIKGRIHIQLEGFHAGILKCIHFSSFCCSLFF